MTLSAFPTFLSSPSFCGGKRPEFWLKAPGKSILTWHKETISTSLLIFWPWVIGQKDWTAGSSDSFVILVLVWSPAQQFMFSSFLTAALPKLHVGHLLSDPLENLGNPRVHWMVHWYSCQYRYCCIHVKAQKQSGPKLKSVPRQVSKLRPVNSSLLGLLCSIYAAIAMRMLSVWCGAASTVEGLLQSVRTDEPVNRAFQISRCQIPTFTIIVSH